jgi:hypothetical protein
MVVVDTEAAASGCCCKDGEVGKRRVCPLKLALIVDNIAYSNANYAILGIRKCLVDVLVLFLLHLLLGQEGSQRLDAIRGHQTGRREIKVEFCQRVGSCRASEHLSMGDYESDEDKVVYLDYDQNAQLNQNRADTNTRSNGRSLGVKKPIFKPLFQHRRYKGDVSVCTCSVRGFDALID